MTQPTNDPQPAGRLRQHLAEAMAKEAGSLAFRDTGTEWDHARSQWLARADAAVNALHRWEQEGTLMRLCVITGCFRQLNVARVEPGWFRSSAVGYGCPDHAASLWNGDAPHHPSWQPVDERAVLRCTCGWDAGRTRFRGHGATLWQAHALDVLAPAA
ncbi:hypothetical protein OG705_29255 [Streptomyces sp. NBC_00838]|uniref:hypothetical protein n=1 Tax=Streptomyces sp. NBC_00838 TaxID=2903680 RepID=UPI00386EABCC|nr:hypothetical protein OG705_29255 [Streptomyces sp. NBC_00838]